MSESAAGGSQSCLGFRDLLLQHELVGSSGAIERRQIRAINETHNRDRKQHMLIILLQV